MRKKVLENFEYITTIIETHWIQSCNCKYKIMNKEARTIAILVWRSSQNFCGCLLVIINVVYCVVHCIFITLGMFAIRNERDYVMNEDFMKAVRKVGDNKKQEIRDKDGL